MFTYKLEAHDMVTMNRLGELKFDPPVYQQRYFATLSILEDPRWTSKLKKVVEFGCADMRLLPLMRRIETLEHILEVDIDEPTLVSGKHRGEPFTADYIKGRARPLRIEIFRGSITDSVENLRNVDVVIAIEVIEHLEQDVLEKVPENIFGFIQPKLVIISTPNSEYNVLFNGLNANGFRIDDHKFEWTREEFKNWASNICKLYPNYSVAYIGIGSPPPQHKKLGSVTQMAIFARNDLINRPLAAPVVTDLPADTRSTVQYKLIHAVDFPYYIDYRTTDQKIKDEAIHYITRSQGVRRFYNRERGLYQIPILHLIDFAKTVNAKEIDVLNALRELNFQVENDYILLTNGYVEENFNARSDDLYEENEDFLNCEPYQYDEEKDGELPENNSTYVDNNEPEESWD